MKKKTTQTKGELVASATATEKMGRTGKPFIERPERATLSENRDKLFEKFYTNIRILVASQTISMVDLSRQLGLRSGTRLNDLSLGRGNPSSEELIVLAKHFKCSIDDLLNRNAFVSFKDNV